MDYRGRGTEEMKPSMSALSPSALYPHVMHSRYWPLSRTVWMRFVPAALLTESPARKYWLHPAGICRVRRSPRMRTTGKLLS